MQGVNVRHECGRAPSGREYRLGVEDRHALELML
ncbi:hypothetical protein JOD64_001487 [Micromonospora luteifusca]|uniref:Uncharacterized protein n=1 Tax=Micromonospora luteifusca TaxID=709860 RepID=A0ABS2LQ00_9ACTN|nr:hypothetical protein [Micromonospora luteifusca]